MIPAQEISRWYLESEFGPIYNTFSLKTLLVPKFNVEVITANMQLHRYVITISLNEVDKIKHF